MSEGGSGGCFPGCGCFMLLIFMWIMWFGFSYKDKHYDIDCGCNGISVQGPEHDD